jgi:hypothetical protein
MAARITAKEVSLIVNEIFLVRDKSRELVELLQNPTMLQNEREFARQTRDKMQGIQNTSSSNSGSQSQSKNMANPAAPASGKYTGFGSEDINRLGYNKEGQFSQPYDPYTKGQSAPTPQAYVPGQSSAAKTPAEKKEKSKKKIESESDSDSSDSDPDSEDSDEKAKKKRRAAKKAKLAAKALPEPTPAPKVIPTV